ncbi:MAG: dienelactone hydrolase family protein [Gammaproteobacteria bacterium]|nr:dienelactone hydrolase family protein [Gammaproteobacteria bacterium]MCW8909223.1 dienelactone hydrolase family protein [Gammaproteobacteria bacterium]MCW9006184.1 dienelactone hydrolase family protein [Gammaproteobacteria bacterium]MCW9057211.1 dienelactone hydrolase family protein [Gammaproteobacteria bacterium]
MKIRFPLSLMLFILVINAQAAIVIEKVSYREGDTLMKGVIAYDDSIKGERPGVLVVHEWWGHNDYARKRATMLAEMGYTALAVDMYGDGKTANHPDDAGKFSGAVMSNMPVAKARFESAMKTLKQHSTVEDDKIAAIGYCFGGGVVLAMARMGVDLKGVASFHGSVATKSPVQKGQVKAKIRVFNGADDPFVKAEQIVAFKQEMDAASVDYKFVNYPGVKHSFTNPGADEYGKKFNLPLAYDANADKASWADTGVFLNEIFK